MTQPARRFGWTIWVGAILLVSTLALAFLLAHFKTRLAWKNRLPVIGQVADFTLTNQNGRAVSLADLKGRVWIADIIFTRCPGPCAKTTKQMKELQDALPAAGRMKLVSLTTDPDFDTPPVLKAYSQRFGANDERWWFLTGAKEQIAALAIESLKLTAVEKKPEEQENPADLFIHSTIFVVVDKRGQLRGVFQTVDEKMDAIPVQRDILGAVKYLQYER
jgi:protein SCO1/2